MIKEFLDAILAPGKLMAALENVREENARLRHELRHYTEFSYSMRIEAYAKNKPGYMEHLYRSAWSRIIGTISQRREIYEPLITKLSVPERASAPLGYGDDDDDRFPREKLTIRVLIRTPAPMLQGVPVPCEEDPDWVLEEYALQLRESGRIDKRAPFVRISMSKRLDLMNMAVTEERGEMALVTRVAVVRFERDGTPHVVTR